MALKIGDRVELVAGAGAVLFHGLVGVVTRAYPGGRVEVEFDAAEVRARIDFPIGRALHTAPAHDFRRVE